MPRPTATSDPLEAVVDRVARGDTAAFRRVVEATSEPLVRLGARITGSIEEAEDVVQDAYVKAFQALTSGAFDRRASVKTWLYRVVTNAAIDARRKQQRREGKAEPGPQLAPGSPDARVALAELASFLDVLPPEQRAALLLVSVEGFSAAEAAEILNCSEGAVEQRLLRARTALRRRSEEP